jgi:hypothetical protein
MLPHRFLEYPRHNYLHCLCCRYLQWHTGGKHCSFLCDVPSRLVEWHRGSNLYQLPGWKLQPLCRQHSVQLLLPVCCKYLQRCQGCCLHALRSGHLLEQRRSSVLPPGKLERAGLPHMHAVPAWHLLHHAGCHLLLNVHPLRGGLLQSCVWELHQGCLPGVPSWHGGGVSGPGLPGSLQQLSLGQVLRGLWLILL